MYNTLFALIKLIKLKVMMELKIVFKKIWKYLLLFNHFTQKKL